MTLRIRLSLIISLLFLAGMLLGLSFLIISAKQRVVDEVSSAATLTYQLLDTLLPAAGASGTRESNQELLRMLAAIEDVRHVDISVPGMAEQEQAPADEIAAPGWFVDLVLSDPVVYRLPLSEAGGSITLRTNPADEIAEAWRDTRGFMLLLLVVLLVLNGLLYYILGRWLSPVSAILQNLDEVEQGYFTNPLRQRDLPELKVIADKIDSLSRAIRGSREENEKLMRRSLSIQEEERRNLARELHDEMGQSISAIKAIAFSIAERNTDDAMSREGATRIGSISNHVRDHIRSMMHRLRPLVLDELGLVPALEHMADEWNRNHASTFCSFRAGGDFSRLDSEQQIHLYRIVQEALTNVAAHAGANNVAIALDADTDIRLEISDDGRGFDPRQVSPGMGLSGMQERVRALRGTWSLDAGTQGVSISIRFPSDIRKRNDNT